MGLKAKAKPQSPAAAECDDLKSLCAFLGYAPQRIFQVIEFQSQYREIRIPKRSGVGERLLSIPSLELKGIQRSIDARILKDLPVSAEAYGYVAGRSAVEAARRVAGHKAQLRIDLKDFFPSITSGRVFGFFRSIGFDKTVASALTSLTVFNGNLAQGAPTSPTMSNLMCFGMDDQLTRFSQKWKITYTRYSDDLIFVCAENFNCEKFLDRIRKIILDNGFVINDSKTKYTPTEIAETRFRSDGKWESTDLQLAKGLAKCGMTFIKHQLT